MAEKKEGHLRRLNTRTQRSRPWKGAGVMDEWNDMITQMLLHAPDPNEPIPISNRRETIYGVTVPFLLLSWAAVGLRLWVRFRVMREPGWDDLFVVLAAVCILIGNYWSRKLRNHLVAQYCRNHSRFSLYV